MVKDEKNRLLSSESLLLHWHHKLVHLSFYKIRITASKGDIPRELSRCRIPLCSTCLFGKDTKWAWQKKGPINRIHGQTVTNPGECVSIDQLQSLIWVFVGQMKGWLTQVQYDSATLFVDHYSGLLYVHVHNSANGEETVLAKKTYKTWCRNYGVTIRHYLSDNGRFAVNKFLQAVSESPHQTISFCGVNAHHQNGVAEKHIRDLQELSRTGVMHDQQRWYNAIISNLWQFSLKMANDVHQSMPSLKDSISPLEKFSQFAVRPKISSLRHFGCPVYVVENTLATGKSLPKREDCAQVGIYLGPSSLNAWSVAIMLSLTTGLVSPQFHVVFDDHFQMVRKNVPGSLYFKLEWQRLAGFNLDAVLTSSKRHQ